MWDTIKKIKLNTFSNYMQPIKTKSVEKVIKLREKRGSAWKNPNNPKK